MILLQWICLLAISLAAILSLCKWKKLTTAEKVFSLLLGLSFLNEVICRVLLAQKLTLAPAHHIFSMIEISLISAFFIRIHKPKNYGYYVVSATIFWICIGILNILFVKSIYKLNSNMLLLESFAIILMCLYTLYRLLIDDEMASVLRNPLFLLVALQLLLWGGSFLFWGIGVFFINNGSGSSTLNIFHLVLNIAIYSGIFFVFYFYDKLESK